MGAALKAKSEVSSTSPVLHPLDGNGDFLNDEKGLDLCLKKILDEVGWWLPTKILQIFSQFKDLHKSSRN